MHSKTPLFYGLKDRKPVPYCDMEDYSNGNHPTKSDVRVDFTCVSDAEVSTVFLVVDHSITGKPVLFETMIFGGEYDEHCWRYYTLEDAERGHKEIVEKLQKGEPLDENGIEAAIK